MKAVNLTLIGLLFASQTATAVSKAELEERILKLEQKLNRVLLERHDQLNTLDKELRQLRGDIEVQAHELQSLQKKQRDLYLDTDRRLRSIEPGGAIPKDTNQSGAKPTQPSQTQNQQTSRSQGSEAARQAYDRALGVLRKGQYDNALAAFKRYLGDYPNTVYAANAQYWVGEVYYVTRKFPLALKEFDRVLNKYPGNPKVADALLKKGFINYEMKQWAAARKALEQVKKRFPGTAAARLAKERLQRIRNEGH